MKHGLLKKIADAFLSKLQLNECSIFSLYFQPILTKNDDRASSLEKIGQNSIPLEKILDSPLHWAKLVKTLLFCELSQIVCSLGVVDVLFPKKRTRWQFECD